MTRPLKNGSTRRHPITNGHFTDYRRADPLPHRTTTQLTSHTRHGCLAPISHSLFTNISQSQQYLQTHTTPSAHPTDIFSLAVTPTQLLTASGSAHLRVYRTTDDGGDGGDDGDATGPYGLVQTLEGAHALGCHHVCVSGDGRTAVSVGFGGEVRVWRTVGEEEEAEGKERVWRASGSVVPAGGAGKRGDGMGEHWAVALDGSGRWLAATTHDGRVPVYDLAGITGEGGGGDVQPTTTYETAGTTTGLGLCVAMTGDGRMTASGHAHGGVYVFGGGGGGTTRRRSLAGLRGRAVRRVCFSPGGWRLAAAGDGGVICVYDVQSGEQTAVWAHHHAYGAAASLSSGGGGGGGSWVTGLDWHGSGEWVVSASHDGRARVWSVEGGECVATVTRGEGEKSADGLWDVRWLAGGGGRRAAAAARFVTGGGGGGGDLLPGGGVNLGPQASTQRKVCPRQTRGMPETNSFDA